MKTLFLITALSLSFACAGCSPGKIIYVETNVYVESTGSGNVDINPGLDTTSGDLDSTPETELQVPLVPGVL